MKDFFLFGLCGLLIPAAAQAQLVVDDSMTPAELVQNVLVGGGVTVSNVTFNGGSADVLNEQIGSFNGTNSNVGLSRGLLFATGDIEEAIGPNNDDGVSLGGGNFGRTDPDLEILSDNGMSDAAVLEFDFIPSGDTLKFNYVFASDEYPDFVCSVNDAFGFFLSGPGISGPFTNNAINIALVPQTDLPVTINNVNNGYYNDPNSPGCPATNPQYYINNGDGATSPNDTDPYYIQYDGFTVVLEAKTVVQCGVSYHIKLAIGDADFLFGPDAFFDSGVFLQAGSFSSNALPELTAATITGDGIVSEGCEGSVFVVYRPDGVDTTITIDYFLSGSATAGVDYQPLPNPIVIPEGEDSVFYDLDPIADALSEGLEDVVLTVFAVTNCGDSIFSSTTITIADYEPVQVVTQNEIGLHCDQDSVLLTAHALGGYGNVTVAWDGGTSDERWIPGRSSGQYTVVAADQCPNTSSITVIVDSGCEVIIPNVLTPNGDEWNNVFKIAGILGKDNRVQIFDRWGKEVFSAQNYRNTFRATDLADGVYFYAVQVEEQWYKGNITVIANKR